MTTAAVQPAHRTPRSSMPGPAPRRRGRNASPTPEADGFDRAYWLGHCEGFHVEGDGGRIGFVEEVRNRQGRAVLAVRAGRLGRRILLVPADGVAFIVPRARRLWLRSPATIIDSETYLPSGGA